MKIGFVTIQPLTINAWSGTNFYLSKALEKHNELYYIDNLQYSLIDKFIYLPFRIIAKVRGKEFYWDKSNRVLKKLAEQIGKRIQSDTDVLIVPGAWGLPIVFLNTNIPIVLFQDAQFLSLNEDYEHDRIRLDKKIIVNTTNLENKVLNKASLVIYNSNWAAESAKRLYKLHEDKIAVVPLGANINCDRTIDVIRKLIDERSRDRCNLLFVGVDWYRKNCELCIEISKSLNKRGIPTNLNIVGLDKLPMKGLPSYIINHGFISKESFEGMRQLNELFSEAHFLIVPSRQEAYGLVFCEANSFGVPSISTNVGGINDIIENNLNGIKFPLDASVEDYAAWIVENFTDKEKYDELAMNSFLEYKRRLNWETSGALLNNLISKFE